MRKVLTKNNNNTGTDTNTLLHYIGCEQYMTNERIESLPASELDLDLGRHNDMLNLYNSIFGHSDADKTQLPCEFCGDLFPVDTLIMHQVRMQSSQKTVHQ